MNALLSSRIVGLTAAIALLAANLSAEPAWAPNKAYSVGARVVYADKLYQCIQSHTSQSTWTPPATPALWVRPEPAACSSWQSQTSYALGSVAKYDGKLYRVIQAHTSQSTWTPPATPALWSVAAGDVCVPIPAKISDVLDHMLDMARGKMTTAVNARFKQAFDQQLAQPTLDGLRYRGASEETIATVAAQLAALKEDYANRAGASMAALLDGQFVAGDLQRRLEPLLQNPSAAPTSVEIASQEFGTLAVTSAQTVDDILRDGFDPGQVDYLWDGVKTTHRFRRSDQPTLVFADVKTEVKGETKPGSPPNSPPKTTITGTVTVTGKVGGLDLGIQVQGKVELKTGKEPTYSGTVGAVWTF